MNHSELIRIAREQLAIDLNCLYSDFDKDGIIFCEAKDNFGRRPFARGERHFEMLTMGRAVIVSATADILPFVREQLMDKTRDEAFCMPFVHGQGLYFLPDELRLMPLLDDFRFEIAEREAIIGKLYECKGFRHAMHYNDAHPRPDMLAMTVAKDNKIVGVACSSSDCERLWQIGIDVLPEYRGKGLAAILTNHLAIEIMKRGKVPYYGTSTANIASQGAAYRAGFKAAWTCTFRGLFDGELTSPTG